MKRIGVVAIALAYLVLASTVDLAQTSSGSQVSGTVEDSGRAVVPGAQVQIKQIDTGLVRTTVSDAMGFYTFPNLPVGPYRLEVRATGFSTYVQTGIILEVNTNPTIDPILNVGSVSQQVEVKADAAMVETKETSIGQAVTEQSISELPLQARQVTQLLTLSGASVETGGATDRNYPSAVQISVAGGPSSSTNYILDGGIHMDAVSNVNLPLPFPDAVREFKVETSSLPARYGLHSGGVVNAVTKSGDNTVHGSAFEFLRNYLFNARNYFAPVRDSLKQNQFGGTIGGPITHDKLFYFGGIQGTIVRSDPEVSTAFVPSQAMLNGDFSTAVGSSCTSNPITLKAPYVGNKVNPAMFNQQALNVLKYIPVASNPCGLTYFGDPQDTNEYEAITRVDYLVNSKQTLFGRYLIANYTLPAVFDGKNALTTGVPGLKDRAQSALLGHNYVINPKSLNSIRLTFTRLAIARFYPDNLFTPCGLGVQIYCGLPHYLELAITSGFNIGSKGSSPGFFATNTVQVVEDVDLIRGAHQIAFGLDYLHPQLNANPASRLNGLFTFNGQITGNGLADFLLGLPSTFVQGNAQLPYDRANSYGLYVQDSWKINRRLSVNAGVRWEPYLPAHNAKGLTSNFEPSWFAEGVKSKVFTSAPAGILFHGDSGMPDSSETFGKLANFLPRIGLVFDVAGNGRTVIRSGYGILYDWPQMWRTGMPTLNPPYGDQISLTNPVGGYTNPWQGYPGGNPFPTPVPLPANIQFPQFATYYVFPLHLKPTYVQQWNLSLEKQLGADWMISASYLGNETTHMQLGYDLNSPVFVPGTCGSSACSTVGNENQRRQLFREDPVNGQAYAQVIINDDNPTANYNALLLSVNKRFSKNFSLLSNYTWSHCIDDGEPGIDINNNYQNPNDLAAERGSCVSDRRQIVNFSAITQTPKFTSRWLQIFAGNWDLANVFSAQSGEFSEVTVGQDRSLTGEANDRPNLIGNPKLSHPGPQAWFNTAAFQLNPLGTFGDVGRNTLLDPGAWDMDLTLSRSFPIRESSHFQLRASAFNVFNHTRFSAPTTSMNVTNFGAITAAEDPRIMQLAVNYSF